MTVTLTERDNGARITAHVGDAIDIRLAENATTGYRWTPAEPVDGVLELSATGADYPGPALGSGGEARFRLTVSAPGTAVLRLAYRRPWEPGQDAERTFSIEVSAVPA
jgi:inhibitor of cysteine peptidase